MRTRVLFSCVTATWCTFGLIATTPGLQNLSFGQWRSCHEIRTHALQQRLPWQHCSPFSLPFSLRRPAQCVTADARERHGRSDQLANPTAEIGGREAPRAYALRNMHCIHRAEHRYAERCTDHTGGIDETRCGA